MRKTRRRRCLGCQKLFRGDPRTCTQQKYCSEPACRAASKQASQRRWLQKPENQQYFCGPQHVNRVQAWRAENRGYGQETRIAARELQETRLAQDPERAGKSARLPLQETRRPQNVDLVDTQDAARTAALQDLM